MVKNPSQISEKQIRRASGATDDYRTGVQNPEKDPIKAALEKNDKRIARLQESIQKKTWEQTMAKKTMSEWQEAAAGKGADRFASGVEQASDKINDFWTKWTPRLNAIQQSVNSMPDKTDSDRERKMIENMKKLKDAKGSWR